MFNSESATKTWTKQVLLHACSKHESEVVMILACVTQKMLGKKMLDHLNDVEQYYKWW